MSDGIIIGLVGLAFGLASLPDTDMRGLLIGLGLSLGFFSGASIAEDAARDTECSLRFELAATAADTLAVVREYPYCADRLERS